MRNLIISISTFHLAFLVFSEASSQDLPDLSRLDYEVRTSIESACGYKKRMEGPASYARCINKQLTSIGLTPKQRQEPRIATRTAPTRKYIPTVIKPKRQPKVARPNPKSTIPKISETSGSGFFISKLGHIITNEHVVRNCERVTVGDSAKKQVSAYVLETDRRNDLALLKLSSTKMASTETQSLVRKLGISIVPLSARGLLRSKDVELGESVLVAGYPYGEFFSNSIKVTGGMVSAIRGMGDDIGQFQIDAAVQPGNSGGPIYDGYGNIVGLVISQLNKLKVAKAIGSLPENVNFGIKASTVRQFLTASGLPTKWSEKSKSMTTRDLAKIAKHQTVMVVCHQ